MAVFLHYEILLSTFLSFLYLLSVFFFSTWLNKIKLKCATNSKINHIHLLFSIQMFPINYD